MPTRTIDIGVVTDEVSLNLAEALEVSEGWGLRRFELREGSQQRFPRLTPEEIHDVEAAMRRGSRITAVSPGILKGHVEDTARLREELEQTLPRSLELAARFACPMLIVFGFERYEGEPAGNRLRAMRAFEQVAEAAAEAGMIVAVENEPNFWIDRPEEEAALLAEIGHPALRANWDPANLQWGGHVPSHDDFEVLRPHLANLHVKDYAPSNPERLWPPVGQGEMAWPEILHWVVEETELPHVTLETHCLPRIESSRQSVEAMREMLAQGWTADGELEDRRR